MAGAIWSPRHTCIALCLLLGVGAMSFGPAITAEQVPWTGTASAQEAPTPAPAPSAAATADQTYLDWLLAHQQRQLAVVQAVPSTLDLASAAWRRDLALALDSWGALIQQARDQRPPAAWQAAHRTLLDALDDLDRARRLLLVAATTGEDPGPEVAAELQRGRLALTAAADQARAVAAGRPLPRRPSPTLGNLRVSLLGTARPYADRGPPADPAYEYMVLRLRLESVAGEPVTYDAFHFRLRTADQTLQNPVSLGLADELLYGALEGNRLAGEIVGNVAFPVRIGVPAIALFYASDRGEPPLEVPIGPPRPAPTVPPGPVGTAASD